MKKIKQDDKGRGKHGLRATLETEYRKLSLNDNKKPVIQKGKRRAQKKEQ